MINNLWKCFETTGDIHTYLGFKDYERTKNQHIGVESMDQSEGQQILNEANEI
ncbi:MAG: YqzL family protein [Cellulosilyticaceae bacterium]